MLYFFGMTFLWPIHSGSEIRCDRIATNLLSEVIGLYANPFQFLPTNPLQCIIQLSPICPLTCQQKEELDTPPKPDLPHLRHFTTQSLCIPTLDRPCNKTLRISRRCLCLFPCMFGPKRSWVQLAVQKKRGEHKQSPTKAENSADLNITTIETEWVLQKVAGLQKEHSHSPSI